MDKFKAFNLFNKTAFLEALEKAHQDDPAGEPGACRLLRLHIKGEGVFLIPNFETAYAVQPDLPYRFAESLFILQDERGEVFPSQQVMRLLQKHRKDLHLDSLFRFWHGFDAAASFFIEHPEMSHLSMNIPAYAAVSIRFSKHFAKGADLFHAAFPEKGLILEMLEYQPWGDAQRRVMEHLSSHGICWAVDDYGAPGGNHTAISLRLAAEHARLFPPLVKFDGLLLTKSLAKENYTQFLHHLHDVEKECPRALLLFEWINHTEDLLKLNHVMCEGGIRLKISYVQSRAFSEEERQKALTALGCKPN